MSYTTELEHLILDVLLPFYENHSKDISKIDSEVLRQLKRKKQIPALFKPKDKNVDNRNARTIP